MSATRVRSSLLVISAIAATLSGALTFGASAQDGAAEADPRRPLSDDALDSLVATTRAFGYVRHFNPARESLGLDWAHFAANAALVMEGVEGAAARVDALSRLFGAIAPAVEFHLTEGEAPEPELIRASPDEPIVSIVVWDHRGFGPINISHGMFYSHRVGIGLESGKQLRKYPSPMSPHRADLGGGVSSMTPTSLWSNQYAQTLPVASDEANASMPRPLNSATREQTRRAVRLADVMIAWNVLRHFHPWAELSDAEWDEALREALRIAAVSGDDAHDRRRAVQALLARIGDGQAVLVEHEPEAEYAPALSFEFVGARLLVSGVHAADANDPDSVAPGDEVTAIDGEAIATIVERESRRFGASNDAHRRWTALENVSLGPRGSELALRVRGEDGGERDVTLRRTEPPSALRTARAGLVHTPAPGVVYIDASRMDEDALFEELQKHGGARGIVFDYRGASDGALGTQLGVLLRPGTEPTNPAGVWIPTPRLPDRIDFEYLQRPTALITKPPALDAKVVFLADGRTIGKAEADLITVRELGLGIIVGERTAGAPGAHLMQEWLPGGLWLRWTGVRIRTSDGESFERRGVEPDIVVARTARGVAEQRDEALDHAIELILR